jgi:hypothetical protein
MIEITPQMRVLVAIEPVDGRKGSRCIRRREESRDRAREAGLRRSVPGCEKGRVYEQQDPPVLVRIVGQAPLAATVYELQRLRCNLCGEIYTAEAPEGVGEEKYEDTAAGGGTHRGLLSALP